MNSSVPVKPYPGLASFADRPEDRTLFFGRKKESQALLEMVLSENLVLLFARSGIGKTSLINAGVLEELRNKGFFPVVVRLTHDPSRGPTQSVYECVSQQAERTGVRTSGNPSSQSLWEYFNEAEFSKDDRLLRPILVLDQFEELFTIIGPQRSWRESFIRDLADLVRRRVPEEIRTRETAKLEQLEKLGADHPERKRIASLLYEGEGPDVKILISIREDFLAEMETLKTQLPTIFRSSFRLEPLSIEEARNAIELPTQQADLLGNNTFTFAPGVVDELLSFLRMQNQGGKLIVGDTVEPVQLQILCQHLYRQSVKKKTPRDQNSPSAPQEEVIPEITVADLKGRYGMKRAIAGYYHKVLKEFPRLKSGWSPRRYRPSLANLVVFHRARAAIRYLTENKLVTPGGYRNSLSLDVIERGIGVPRQDLSRLVDERLLRTEPRLGSHFYELTHDTLISTLVSARRKRRTHWAAMILIPLVLLVYLPGFSSFWRYLEIQSYKRQVRDKEETPEVRIKAFKALVTTPRYRDCSKCDLTQPTGMAPMNLHALSAYGVGLSDARLMDADFNGSTIAFSDFSKADLSRANFGGATLSSSDFSDATLIDTKLENANLKEADFTNATLTGANLVRAQLDNADMTGARVDPTSFQGKDDKGNPTLETIWWTAVWPSQSLKEMQNRIPYQDIAKGLAFQKQLQNLDLLVNYYDDALAFNNRAWYRAQCGTDLWAAEQDARKARSLDPHFDRPMDTLGYVLLQENKIDEAIAQLEESLQTRKEADPFRRGLAHYHLALAYERKGNQAVAKSHFDSAKEEGYRPTYECLLTPPSDMKNCAWPNPRKNQVDLIRWLFRTATSRF